MKHSENLRDLRENYISFFKDMVEEWPEAMIQDYLKANGLQKRHDDRDILIARIIDNEYDYISGASSEDIKDQYSLWNHIGI